MRSWLRLTCLATLAIATPPLTADIIVDYTVDAGGHSGGPLNGLAARGTFIVTDEHLSITLENTSTGLPDSFGTSDSLLTSLGLNFLDGVEILSGDSARIGPGSIGLGEWSDLVAGDDVGEEWIWTNDFGGDLLEDYAQVISTSAGHGGGSATRFDGGSGTVSGPYGGITADPPLISIPPSKPAVSDSIVFELTLSAGLSEPQIAEIAQNSRVEFGSDQRYLGVPEPAAALLALTGLLWAGRRSTSVFAR